MMEKCDIIIPVWNELESTRKCINTLRNSTHYPYRLIIVDNGSESPTKSYIEDLDKSFKDILILRNSKNLGFVKAVNQGFVASREPYVCLLNNDAYVTENWLSNLIETVETGPKNIGIANPTSNVFGKESSDGKRNEYQELDSGKGFCMLIKREVIKKVGLFDEIYGVGYFEEKDFSRKAIEAGYISIRAKSSFVFHKDRVSFDKLKDRDDIFNRNEAIYNKRWGKPQSVAFVIQKKSDIEKNKDMIYELLNKGHRVNIFFRKINATSSLKDHINIKYFPLKSIGFGYIILFKLWERRKKKRIETIIVEDKKCRKFFNQFRFVHGASVKE